MSYKIAQIIFILMTTKNTPKIILKGPLKVLNPC